MSSSIRRQIAGIALLAIALPFLPACHKSHNLAPCLQDSDCDSDQVCFLDGCGDPGRDMRVEVSPQTAAGPFAEDLALDDVRARQDLTVSYPAVLQGSITFLNDNPPQVLPYTGRVSIRGQGESEIIPGVQRTFEVALDLSQNGIIDGSFSLPVNAGVYSITANSLDSNKPPATIQTQTAIRPGLVSNIDIPLGAFFPIYDVLAQVTGPNIPGGLDVQAFSDPVNLRPFSQRVRASAGAFHLQLSPSVLLNRSFIVQIYPRDPTAIVPQKTFGPIIASPIPPNLVLELGEYGEPVRVTGKIVDSHGAAIPNATVYLDGKVGGGGTFRTQGVTTDDHGNFSLRALRSDSSSTFWAIPPTQSSSGILRSSLPIGPDPVSLGNISCPDKVLVQGNLFSSDGSNAPGVRVVAVPIQPLTDLPLPGSGDQAVTNTDSSFSLKLDPAIYRLDFVPGDQLPRASRFARVTAELNPGGGFKPLQVSDFALSKGRRITGNVFAVMSPGDDSPKIAPFTSLRFFRLSIDLNGKLSSSLLAETVSDARGTYSVNLPAR